MDPFTKDSIRIGVIGAGNWGKNYLRVLQEVDNVKLSWCCDVNPKQHEMLKHRYPQLHFTTDVNKLLRDNGLEAVIIATPPHTHFSIAQKMLQAGKHVLVEKPFTLSLEQTCLLFQIAEQRKRILMAGHVMEYHSSVLWLKQYLQQGHLGQLFYLCFNRSNLGRVRQDVSVVWDLAVHDLAMLRYLIEEEPVAISAFGGCYLQPDIFDVVFITLHFAGNVVAQVHASWLQSCKTRQAVVIGKKQMIKFDDVTNQDKIRIYDCGITSYEEGLEAGSAGYRFVPRYGDIFLPAIPETEPLLQQCRHFVDCIYENKGPVTGKPDTLWVTKAALLAEQSLRQDGSPLAFTT